VDMQDKLSVLSAPSVRAMLCGSGGVLVMALAFGCGGGSGETGGAGGATTTTSTSTTTATVTGGECTAASDCPDTSGPCVLRACIGGACGTVNAGEGTVIADQKAGDCKVTVCDGNGATTSVDDPGDVPNDDKQCTVDACNNGSPSHANAAAGTVCGEGGGSKCDGNGACVACMADADCAVGLCSSGHCVAPSCADGTMNAGETDVDCGGPECAPCAVNGACSAHADCASGVCAAGKCASGAPLILPISAAGHDRFFGATFDAQGNIYAVGVTAPGTDSSTDYATVVAKLTPQGVLDTTFGAGGFAIKNVFVGANGEVTRGIVVQSTGKIVVAGAVEHAGAADPRDRDMFAARFNADGTLDTTFGTGGVAILDLSDGEVVGNGFVADSQWGLAVYPDDRLVISGGQKREGATDTDWAIVRLTANGARDTTFGTNGVFSLDVDNVNNNPRNPTILPDGSVISSGYYTSNGVILPGIFKLTPNGTLDTTFGVNGVFNQPVFAAQTEAYGVALQGTKLVTTGYGRNDSAEESLDWVSLRLTANGKLDPSYGINGAVRVDVAGFSDNSRSLTVLPDGRIALVGGGRATSGDVDGMVAILTPNGQPDTAFAPFGWKLYDLGGVSDFLWGVAVAPSGKYMALSGIKSNGSGAGNDDGAILLVPVGN
jgi:uncharacterized delta-60 repeat protein